MCECEIFVFGGASPGRPTAREASGADTGDVSYSCRPCFCCTSRSRPAILNELLVVVFASSSPPSTTQCLWPVIKELLRDEGKGATRESYYWARVKSSESFRLVRKF